MRTQFGSPAAGDASPPTYLLPDDEGTLVDALTPLRKYVAGAAGRVLVLADETTADLCRRLSTMPKATVVTLEAAARVGAIPGPPEEPYAAVLATFADRVALRHWRRTLPDLPPVESLALWFAESYNPAPIGWRPGWPQLLRCRGRRTPLGSTFTLATYAAPIDPREVLAHSAATCSDGPDLTQGIVVVGPPDAAGLIDAIDDSTRPLVGSGVDFDPETDADLRLVTTDPTAPTAPAALTEEPDQPSRPPIVALAEVWGRPIDEAIINPRGFRVEHEDPIVDLRPLPGRRYLVDLPEWTVLLEGRRGVTEKAVRRLRRLLGLRILWPAVDHADHAYVVAGLAMAGIPVFGPEPPPESRRALGDDLADALVGEPDLESALRREEHSLRIRRAALLTHSQRAWRLRLAERAGINRPMFPSVSVLLATMRPHQLEFALRQFTRQVGVEKELVIAAHGWTPDPGVVREIAGDLPVTVLPLPAETTFGAVQNAAAEAASGDVVVKFDDDDWYARESLLDLVLAKHYARADMVGVPVQFTFLERAWTMVRRKFLAERDATFVAGGAMMMDRSALQEWGGFRRVRKWVDADLLVTAVSQEATIYRTHGLGYVLRRSAGGGHTWAEDVDFFMDADKLVASWPDFTPSLALDPDRADLPVRPVDAEAR